MFPYRTVSYCWAGADHVREVQPITIGTRLSVSGSATSPKGPDFPQQPSWQRGTLGNITLQTNLHDRVSLYLNHVQKAVSPMSVPPTTASRSIRKP